jgi:16S rRNA (adenine1518-N6/adenine1519-N6)-dimethyltransferase
MYVKAKKSLGQHFLKDHNIARKIAGSLTGIGYNNILEIGPGMGILTRYLLDNNVVPLLVVEIDKESVAYLQDNFPQLENKIISSDFLEISLSDYIQATAAIIGNFPYNISSQIFFKILENKSVVTEVVCMIQKEVAERISSPPGNKTYGILSVLLQAFYNIEYLFTVSEHVFAPPPKVKSAVIRLRRNSRLNLGCDEELFFKVVKTSFNQRRKTIHNSLKSLNLNNSEYKLLQKRPEQLSVNEFVELTNWVAANTIPLKTENK